MTSSHPKAPTLVALAAAVVMIAQQVAAKATRDAIFLSTFEPADLLLAMIAAAGLSGVVAIGMAAALSRLGPARLVPAAFALHGGVFIFEWWLFGQSEATAAVLIYLHVGALGATVISGFWSVINERFDPHTAKRVVGTLGAGATVGGMAGGLLAERVSDLLSVSAILPMLAILNFLCAALVGMLAQGSERGADTVTAGQSLAETARSLLNAPLLRKISALVVLTGITAAILDYTVKAGAASTFESPEQLARFFAMFYTGVSILTFLVQAGLGTRVLRTLGLSATIALLPASVMLTSVLGAAVQRLWTAVVAAGAEQVLRSSVYRSGYELLYTPMAPAQKRPAKALIDVAFDRLGDALGAGLVLLLIALIPRYAEPSALALAGVSAMLALFVALRLHQDYVDELAASLRSGVVKLGPGDVYDATTMRTLADTATEINRNDLLQQIESLRAAQQDQEQRAKAPPSVPSDSVLSRLTALSSGDRDTIAAALAGPPLHPAHVAFILPLVTDPGLGAAAVAALDACAEDAAGQLGDAMLSAETPLDVRVRLARVLGRGGGQRARDALLQAAADDAFELRYHAVQGLLALVERAPQWVPEPPLLAAAALRELGVADDVWSARRAESMVDGPVFASPALHGRVPHALEHVLSLMAVASDREPLRMCLKALCGKDAVNRGTALEYLQNILPAGVHALLEQRLLARGAGALPRTKPRALHELTAELLRSTDSES